jgi:hypothetical protein
LIRPIDLGWHTKRADVAAGLQVYAPTGRYERGGDDNIGKGMWTYEPFLGTTLYFDEARTVSLAATAYWELHGDKKDTNVNVGQILSIQGGLGKSFLGGGLIIGGASTPRRCARRRGRPCSPGVRSRPPLPASARSCPTPRRRSR